jgi:hypothetical protein
MTVGRYWKTGVKHHNPNPQITQMSNLTKVENITMSKGPKY